MLVMILYVHLIMTNLLLREDLSLYEADVMLFWRENKSLGCWKALLMWVGAGGLELSFCPLELCLKLKLCD